MEYFPPNKKRTPAESSKQYLHGLEELMIQRYVE